MYVCLYVCMYVYMCVCVCVYVCMYVYICVCVCVFMLVCMYVYVCVQSVTVITFHYISCPVFCTKENTVSSKQEVCELCVCHNLQCIQIYICFHELFVRFVTNKDKLVHISLLIFISALVSDPQSGQLYFIPSIGRDFYYHHLVQTDVEI
jgi:hypothetical protein